MNRIIYVAFFFVSLTLYAQIPQPTDSQKIIDGLEQLDTMSETSRFKNLPFKNIGPTIMSGRVVDLDVNPNNPNEFLVAYASGGLWHTTNNGTSFTPIMDNAPTINLGDIAVDWTTKTIWAGTGENNSSRSSYAGIGVLKSNDWGKSWSKPMLKGSHHIGRILINPNNTDHVVIAVAGPLYSDSSDRGIYTTMDAGLTWKKTLFATDDAGFIDLAHAPENFNVMYAASWQKDRKAWNFMGNGSASAIYKSTDAGATWDKITTANSGFPTGQGVGRIGLAVYDANTVYAVHDSQFRRPKEEDADSASAKAKLSKGDFKEMTKVAFLKLDNKSLNAYLKENGFQEKYRAENVKNMVSNGAAKPADLALYLENANTQLFDTPVKGAELFITTNGGESWTKTHEGQIDGVFYSYGYYFAQVRVDPSDVNHVYVMGVPIIKSLDGGKNWQNISRENVHADHHALWINPNLRGHIINGNDGGVNISYDDGETWIKNNSPSVGQFYAINYDFEQPYNVYGGLQDNGVWVGAHNASENRAWHQQGQYPWEFIMGGDGMQIQIDSRDPNVVYTGFQFGNYYRLNRATGQRTYIQPKHELGESPYRFNWQTPILLSSHNQDIIYLGGNKLHRSMNNGDDWTAISPDLTLGGKPGNVAYGTLTTISESPFQFGLIYTGSDDGVIQRTNDAGSSWEKLNGNWPANLWVSRVVASQHDKATVYATLNGYRWDDFTAYVYKSTDYGKTWVNIGLNLPASSVNVITEHPKDKNVLFLGTDNASFVSINSGSSWELLNNGMPPVAVHDIKIQPEANDLLIGTHGRSIYQANLDPIKLLYSNEHDLALAQINGFRSSSRYGTKRNWSDDYYEPTVQIFYASDKNGAVQIEILNKKGETLYTKNITSVEGLNTFEYTGLVSDKGVKKFDKNNRPIKADNGNYYLVKGEYIVRLSTGKYYVEQPLEVK